MTATTLPWNSDVQAIPFDKPVLVRERDEPVPFMVVRHADFNPEAVSYLLGPDASGYGIFVGIERLEAFAEVM